MSLLLKIVLGVVIGLLAIPVGFVALLFIYGGDMCGNYIHKEYLSPDARHKAVVFQRDCGATTSFSTQISIISAKEELENTKGNIYIIDGHPEDVAPNLIWHSENTLGIQRQLNGSEYKAKSSWGWFNKIAVAYGSS